MLACLLACTLARSLSLSDTHTIGAHRYIVNATRKTNGKMKRGPWNWSHSQWKSTQEAKSYDNQCNKYSCHCPNTSTSLKMPWAVLWRCCGGVGGSQRGRSLSIDAFRRAINLGPRWRRMTGVHTLWSVCNKSIKPQIPFTLHPSPFTTALQTRAWTRDTRNGHTGRIHGAAWLGFSVSRLPSILS